MPIKFDGQGNDKMVDIKVLVNWASELTTVKGQVQLSNEVRFIPGRILGTKGGTFSRANNPPAPIMLTIAGASAPKADGMGLMEYVDTTANIAMKGDFPPQCKFLPDPNRKILSQQLRVTFTWPANAALDDELTLEDPLFDLHAVRRNSEEGKECPK